jgi:hypothetical protein
MSQLLTLELSDTEYAALEKAARASGAAPDEWAAARLREQLPLAAENGSSAGIAPENYELLLGVAARTGRSIENVVAKFRQEVAPEPRPRLSPEERLAADERLSRHVVSLGYATGADNESIDADLAREYADDHAGLYRRETGEASG